jgi:UDP-3-O-[3-hydroxymyristoyl] glucosamine N-acyltransferase
MNATLQDLAELVGGSLCGEGETVITGAATLACARPGEITLCDSERYNVHLARSLATAVVVGPAYRPQNFPYIVVENVASAFARIVTHFRPPRARRIVGIHPGAFISPSARLGTGVEIHAGATIGDDVEIDEGTIIHPGVRIADGCRIGRNCVLFPNVVLYENSVLGDRVTLHAGAVIGAYGFGYATIEGKHQLSAQLGFVEIGDDVEIGACSTVDRGTYGPTLIGTGTKIDNQVMIAHNCRIGKHNLICSQVGIAGSSSTGDYVVLAGQVGIRDHVHIGDRAMLGAKSGVMCDIAAGTAQVGIPCTPQRDQMLIQAAIAKLPEMRKQLRDLLQRTPKMAKPAEATPVIAEEPPLLKPHSEAA